MSYPINQQTNPYKLPQPQQQQPAMGLNTQSFDAEKLRENVENQNNLITQASEQENPGLLLGLTIPIWLGISKLMEKFNAACRTKTVTTPDGKTVETGLLHKTRDLGDKIGGHLENNFTKGATSKIKSVITFIDNKIVKKSSILNAFVHNPTKPVNSMAKTMAKGTIAETAQDGMQALEKYFELEGGLDAKKLEKLGLNPEKFTKMLENPQNFADDLVQVWKKSSNKLVNVQDFSAEVINKISKNPKENLNSIINIMNQYAQKPTSIIDLDKIMSLGINETKLAAMMKNPEAYADDFINLWTKHSGALLESGIIQPLKAGSGRFAPKLNIQEARIISEAPKENLGKIVDIFRQYTHTNLDAKKLSALGLTPTEFKTMSKEYYKPEIVEKIIKTCEKLPKDLEIEVSSSKGLLKKIMSRIVTPSEIINKLKSLNVSAKEATLGMGAKTGLGKALPKYLLRTVEGLTNGTAGGKLAIAMQAYCFADAILRTSKAEKGDKFKTFMESTVNDLSYYLLMPLGISFMHHTGGLKYIGVKDVENYRKELAEFNRNVDLGKFATKKEYKEALKKLKDLLKGDTKVFQGDGIFKASWRAIKNIVRVPLKKAADLLTTGLEVRKPFVPKDGGVIEKALKGAGIKSGSAIKIDSFFRNFGYNMKKGSGYPIRFLGYMMIFAPPLTKLVVKGCHKIFGKPKKSVIDDGKEEKKKKTTPPLIFPAYTDNNAVSQPQVQIPVQPQQVVQPQPQPVLMQPAQQSTAAQYQTAPIQNQNLVNTYNQSSANKGMIPSEKSTRRYIPSSAPVKITAEEYTAKEKKAMSILDKSKNAAKNGNRFVPEKDRVKLED